jgi:hypothetical protein
MMPSLNSRRFWLNATQAEAAGEVGVTAALTVPFSDVSDRNGLEDTHFFADVIKDLGDADWSLCIEEVCGCLGLSIWRVPGRGYIREYVG